ncbi:hypothetical protein POM88_026287 [Heracleum sosnowskyi]|uniref:Uncharacterized protein n=1 Tax=Heracleum sosnowskyi TaxID=360622 RepID=A0AAD8I7Y6_9APIA|nr:hypothetical protein POM88_026287 [Heracleum sosnowskyi]
MDYNSLKTVLKDICHYHGRNRPAPLATDPPGFTRKLTLYRAFSGLNQRTISPKTHDTESQPILVNSAKRSNGEEDCFKKRFQVLLEMVDNSYIGSSDEVAKLMDRVEVAFVKHFSNSNRKKGLSILRPTSKRQRHGITAFLVILSNVEPVSIPWPYPPIEQCGKISYPIEQCITAFQ